MADPNELTVDQLEASATAEADQLTAHLRVTAAGAAFYFAELKSKGLPDAFARRLVSEWQEFYLTSTLDDDE